MGTFPFLLLDQADLFQVHTSILFCSVAIVNYHGLVSSNRNLVFAVVEPGSLRSRGGQRWFLLRPLFALRMLCPHVVLSPCAHSPAVSLSVSLSLSFEGHTRGIWIFPG